MTERELSNAMTAYGDTVYRLALCRLQCVEDAEDVYQDVFLRLLEQRTVGWDGEHVKAWLIRVTINCAKKHYEQYWTRKVEYMEEPERIADEKEILELAGEHPVRAAVQKLPPKYRLVVHLYYYEELSVAQIAKLTEQKESTVKSQMYRAREMLRSLLGEEWETGE